MLFCADISLSWWVGNNRHDAFPTVHECHLWRWFIAGKEEPGRFTECVGSVPQHENKGTGRPQALDDAVLIKNSPTTGADDV